MFGLDEYLAVRSLCQYLNLLGLVVEPDPSLLGLALPLYPMIVGLDAQQAPITVGPAKAGSIECGLCFH